MTMMNTCEDCFVGIQYGDFDGSITASSECSPNHSVLGCKLGKPAPKQGHASAWCPKSDDMNGWIQVRFPYHLNLNAISIQGRGDATQYVTRFRVLVSRDGVNFVNTWEFPGNTDNTTIVKRSFPHPVKALAVRIQILDHRDYPSMRFDLHYIPE